MEPRGPDTDPRIPAGGSYVRVKMCKVQVQLHTLYFGILGGTFVFSHHHCLMILFLVYGCVLLMYGKLCHLK